MCCLVAPLDARAQPEPTPPTRGDIDTVAGGYGFGTATNVTQYPYGLAVASGSLLVAGRSDSGPGVVHRVDLGSGTEEVVAGGFKFPAGTPVDGHKATEVPVAPRGVGVDGSGNVYFVDGMGACAVDRVTPDGAISRIAMLPSCGTGQKNGLVVDAAGNAFVAASTAVIKVTPDGTVTPIAGAGTKSPYGNNA